MKPQNFLGRKLLFVTAHPDDESFLASGTCAMNRRAGGSNYLICLTCGEKGRSHLRRKISRRGLVAMRRAELRVAAVAAGIKKLKVLALPDGGLRGCIAMIAREVMAFARAQKPDYLISFGPDGVSGHEDHIAAGEAAESASSRLDIPFLAFVLPPRLHRGAHKWLKSRRKHGVYATMIRYRKPNLRIAIESRDKLKALKCHRSQLDGSHPFTGFPDHAAAEFLKAEYFFLRK